MRKSKRTEFILACCIVLALVAVCGCGGEEPGESGADAPPPYPASLSANSTPSQVAEVLIQGLDAGDQQLLAGLVAAKHEAEAQDEIYRKHGREHETSPADAARSLAAGWGMTYAWFEPGSTVVVSERITGDTAVVQAQGRNPTTGRPRELTIQMVREDGVWKAVGGLESREL